MVSCQQCVLEPPVDMLASEWRCSYSGFRLHVCGRCRNRFTSV